MEKDWTEIGIQWNSVHPVEQDVGHERRIMVNSFDSFRYVRDRTWVSVKKNRPRRNFYCIDRSTDSTRGSSGGDLAQARSFAGGERADATDRPIPGSMDIDTVLRKVETRDCTPLTHYLIALNSVRVRFYYYY